MSCVRLQACAQGSYSDGSGVCYSCRVNSMFWAPLQNKNACVAWAQPGYFARNANSTSCAACPSGRFQSGSGASDCGICSVGYAALVPARALHSVALCLCRVAQFLHPRRRRVPPVPRERMPTRLVRIRVVIVRSWSLFSVFRQICVLVVRCWPVLQLVSSSNGLHWLAYCGALPRSHSIIFD
jgi:hypothetical protein